MPTPAATRPAAPWTRGQAAGSRPGTRSGWPPSTSPGRRSAAGRRKIVRHLQRSGGLPGIEILADQALTAAKEQSIAVPGERASAALIRELAQEALATRQRTAELDRALPSSAACRAWGPG
jgi:hypothetical protein